MQTIRENIEKIGIYIQKMSNAFQASEEKCKRISLYFQVKLSFCSFIFLPMYSITYSSYIEKYGKTSLGNHNGVPEGM